MISTSWQWLRPEWLWGFVPLLVLALLWLRKRKQQTIWENIVDTDLQPYVIEGGQTQRSFSPYVLFTSWAVILLLLAGPVWKQQEVPVFQAQQSEIILLDLSRSMLTDDVLPDRLTRARFKLLDLLQASSGTQVGLIAFSERPYVVSPLTEDTKTIEAFIPSLSPDIMPVQGSRLDLAIERAVTLFEQAGVDHGHILYIGDENPGSKDFDAARLAQEAGHRLSVLGVGTPAGKPLKDEQGRFLQAADGSVVVPQLNISELQSLAKAGSGVAVRITTDERDIQSLAPIRAGLAIESENPEQAGQNLYWVEFAPWVLWPLVLLALFMFRRGVAL